MSKYLSLLITIVNITILVYVRPTIDELFIDT